VQFYPLTILRLLRRAIAGAGKSVAAAKADGHWCGELMVDSTLCSDYVLFMHWLGEVDRRTSAALRRTF
jgi:squalene-hopene/tetraprenyl-beta-curcumene cyclase